MQEGHPDERYLFLSDVLTTSWQAAKFHKLYDETSLDRHDVLRRMTGEYIEHMHTNEPVHTWPVEA